MASQLTESVLGMVPFGLAYSQIPNAVTNLLQEAVQTIKSILQSAQIALQNVIDTVTRTTSRIVDLTPLSNVLSNLSNTVGKLIK